MKKNKRNDDISFLGRIVVFFRIVKEKIVGWRLFARLISRQKELASYTDVSNSNEAKVAYGFGLAKIVSIALLCVFLSVTLLTGSGIISYENVYYMFKDVGYISSFNESIPEVLSYSKPVNNQDFDSFKNGLAVAGDSEIKFFTSTGRATLTLGSDYTNPKISCSDTNALVYDQGRNTFAVYNSFIKVASDTTDYRISSADMCPDGSFCIVTEEKKYSSAVNFYNNEFEFKWSYFKNDYIISAQISDNGKYVAVLSLDSTAGESRVTLNLLDAAKGEVYSSVVLNGVMPYGAYFISDNRIALICDESTCVYNIKGDIIGRYDYNGALTRIAVTNGGFSLLFDDASVNLGNTLLVFDSNAKLEYSTKLVGNVSDIKMNERSVYLLFNDEILKIDSRYGSEQRASFSEENAEIIVFDNGEVVVCTPVAAYYIPF